MTLPKVLGKTVVAFTGLGFVLPAMTFMLDTVNDFIKYLTTLAMGHIDLAQKFGESLSGTLVNSELNLLMSLVFVILLAVYMFKILLYYGRRWFDIMVAAIVSPFAFAATIFDSTQHYFKQWWSHVLNLYLVQIVHAVYITVISLLVLTADPIETLKEGIIRTLILIGALWRMSEPPRFVSSMSGSPNSMNMIKAVARQVRTVKLPKFKK